MVEAVNPYNRLRDAAAARYRNRCPCCDNEMRVFNPHQHKGVTIPKNAKTKGHLFSRTDVRRDGALWVWMCARCNTNQGSLSLAAWAYKLKQQGDKRAAHVNAFVDWIMAFNIGVITHDRKGNANPLADPPRRVDLQGTG